MSGTYTSEGRTPAGSPLEETTRVGPPPSRNDDVHLPGASVGRYHVLERIGSGSMGVVYAAFDPNLDRKVALKVLRPHSQDDEAGSTGHARLIREAKALAKLAHPNVVTVHDVGIVEDRVFVAMEFVRGQTLSEWMASSTDWRQVVRCFIGAGRGLAAAHDEGLVHRDFKPDNVLIGEDGRPRVLDFGLARRSTDTTPAQQDELHEHALERKLAGYGADNITHTGSFAGTPAYMAPEQFRGQKLDARTDQFAFCVALWEGLHGSRPFRGDSTPALGLAVCAGERAEPPAHSPVPSRIQRALEKGLSRMPSDRFESMKALLDAISPQREPSGRRMWWGFGAIIASGALYASLTNPIEHPCEAGDERSARAWNSDHAARLQKSFADVETAFARDSATTVTARLDDYVERWSATYRDACEATHVRREQSEHALALRMDCLSRHLRGFESTVEAMTRADAQVVEQALAAVGRLPRLETCNDVDALDAYARPPEDANVAAAVRHIRERIAALTARANLARADGLGPDEFRRLLADANETGYLPVVAEAQYLGARLAIRNGDPADAAERLEASVNAALASDHDKVLAAAMIQLVQTTGIHLSRYDEATRWSRRANAAVQRLGNDEVEAANFHDVMCKFLSDRDDTAAALPHCHRNVDLSRTLFGEDSVHAGHARESLGIAYFYGGDLESARETFELAKTVYTKAQGKTHPDLARITNSLAAVCYETRGAPQCLEPFRQAVSLAEAAFGKRHGSTADYRNNLALVLVETGDLAAARQHAAEALGLLRAKHGNEHPGVAASLRILGQADRREGDFEGARDKLIQAMNIARKMRGNQHRDVLAGHMELAELGLDQPDLALAQRHVEAAHQLAKVLNDDDSEIRELQARLQALRTIPQ